ncbi:hypothetical protein ACQW02_27145 [Humitalea sp. 24SJ18S-53]|uniref:hypothetical protein n=1 Tax=Humitalea sp. 24SJ18S-53 TaxID=3422307 RepID=UPI003D675312
MTAPTAEQVLQQKLNAQAQALNARAQQLCDAIEACTQQVGGTSANYPGDALHTVAGTWSVEEETLASNLWLAFHYANLQALAPHVLPPVLKYNAPHAGKYVADFIRRKGGTATGRHIIHVVMK